MSKNNPSNSTFIDHFTDLRNMLIFCFLTVIICSIFSYFFAEDIISFLVSPLNDVMTSVKSTNRLIYTNLAEGFLTYLRISVFSGFVISLPVILYKVWFFISPALKIKEKKIISYFALSSFICFILGFVFCYFYIMPLAWKFLLGFQSLASETSVAIDLEARLGNYISLSIAMILAFGFMFQMPVVLFLLLDANVINVNNLVSFRRYYIVSVFTISALVTPPDVVSQVGLSIPLILFYEVIIYLYRKLKDFDC